MNFAGEVKVMINTKESLLEYLQKLCTQMNDIEMRNICTELLSEYFIAGDAITALSLFSKWDKNALFIASRETDFFYKNLCL